MKFASLLLAARLFARYSGQHKFLFISSSIINALSSLSEALVAISLPLIIGKYLGSSNTESMPPYLLLSSNPAVFFSIIILTLGLKNYSLYLSSRYSASISCSYLDDFCTSFYGQDIDSIKKTTKESLSVFIQGNFPLIGREVFFPSTQIVSSALFIIIILFSVFTFKEVDASLLLILLLTMIISYTLTSSFVVKKLVKFGSQIKNIIFTQGNLVGMLHNSCLDDAYSLKPHKYTLHLLENDRLLKKIQNKSVIYTSLPKSFTESMLLVGTVSVSLIASRDSNVIVSSSALIGVFYILFKLLSAVQQLSRSIFLLKSNVEILNSIETNLKEFKLNKVPNYIRFENHIDSSIILEVRALSVNSRSIQNKLNFSIYDGDICLLDAPSGTGKTRLIYTLTGKLLPLTGNIVFNKILPPTKHFPYLLAQKQQFISGTVNDLIDYGSLSETSLFLQKVSSLYKLNLNPFIEGISIDNSLSSFLQSSSHDLSGGQFQRVLMVKALTCLNTLIILDEPTANLDLSSETKCLNELLKFVTKKPGTALIYTSHSQNAKQLANKVISLS